MNLFPLELDLEQTTSSLKLKSGLQAERERERGRERERERERQVVERSNECGMALLLSCPRKGAAAVWIARVRT